MFRNHQADLGFVDFLNDEIGLYRGIFIVSDTPRLVLEYLHLETSSLNQAASVSRFLINNCRKNRAYLQTVYESVRVIGIVQSQYAFGHLCGGINSWFSATKSRNRPMSLVAMTNLAMNLDRFSPARSRIKELVRTLWLQVKSRAISAPRQRPVLRRNRGLRISQEY